MQRLFNMNSGLFSYAATDTVTHTINPLAPLVSDDYRQQYHFVGRLLGKALLDGQTIDPHLNRPLLKHLLGVPVSFSDLEFVDSSLHQTLGWIINNDGVDLLSIYYTVDEERLGELHCVELIPGGSEVMVNDRNKHDFVKRRYRHAMLDKISDPLGALLDGLYEVIPLGIISVFTPGELELLLCGVSEVNVDEWQASTLYSGGFRSTSPTVIWFWRIVRERLDNEGRSKLLQFVSGTSRVPSGGFKTLQGQDGEIRRFTIERICGGDDEPPRAHTCFNRIDLPTYSSEKILTLVLENLIMGEVDGFNMV
mmetsp:Transcript_110292/g.321217  ORF Transcript_110292/g.321217 Transcript_110292/m.321217 type:complete len:309 (+) Transcript_110292:229-1155(+)